MVGVFSSRLTLPSGACNSENLTCINQEIIVSTETETFVKEPKIAKLFLELKSTPVLYKKKGPLVFLACL